MEFRITYKIDVCNEGIDENRHGYMAQFVYNGVYYCLSGVIEQHEFDEILKKIHL